MNNELKQAIEKTCTEISGLVIKYNSRLEIESITITTHKNISYFTSNDAHALEILNALYILGSCEI